jgi:hypothetical protein
MEATRNRTVYAVQDPDGQFVTQNRRGRTASLSDAGTWISRAAMLDAIKPENVSETFYVPPGQALTGWRVFEVLEVVARHGFPTS